MKVKIKDGCISCGICEGTCPDVFQMGDDGLAHPIVDTVPAGLESQVEEAKDACPVAVIEVE